MSSQLHSRHLVCICACAYGYAAALQLCICMLVHIHTTKHEISRWPLTSSPIRSNQVSADVCSVYLYPPVLNAGRRKKKIPVAAVCLFHFSFHYYMFLSQVHMSSCETVWLSHFNVFCSTCDVYYDLLLLCLIPNPVFLTSGHDNAVLFCHLYSTGSWGQQRGRAPSSSTSASSTRGHQGIAEPTET